MAKKVRQLEPENPWHLGIQDMSLEQAIANPDVRQHVMWDLESTSPALRSLKAPDANKAIAAKANSLIDRYITYVWKNGYDLDQVRTHDTSDRHFLEHKSSREWRGSWRDLHPTEVRRLGIMLGSMNEHLTSYGEKFTPPYRHYYFIMPKPETLEAMRRRKLEWRPAMILPEDTMARCAKLRKKGGRPGRPALVKGTRGKRYQ